MSSLSAIEFGCFNPRRNLPSALARKRGESNFVGAFHRHFTSDREGQGAGGRHFEVVGYGIADFVWLEYGSRGEGCSDTPGEPILIAFEMKLKNWRRALTQAFRYSYFSDRAIVVLPTETADRAQQHLPDFQRLGIGLWSYDPKSATIDMHYTPSGAKAKNPAAREKAIDRISRKIELRKRRK